MNGLFVNDFCITYDIDDLRYKFREFEIVMLGFIFVGECDYVLLENENWKWLMEMISRGNFKEVFVVCVKVILDEDLLIVEWLMLELRYMVLVFGELI